MKKTVSINISGLIFNIDEDAYQKLSNYLNTIRGYFSSSEGRDEIMSDIETRIAEMLQAKINERKQVINLEDIDEVIGIMGEPEAYLDDETAQEQATRAAAANRSGTRRLYRDPDGNVLGGVCSGIGYFFGFDPIWLRIAAVISVVFFGTGILLYIVLWIVIPEAKTSSEKLQMRGEPVNIDNIGKVVEDEIDGLKKKLNSLADGARGLDGKPINERAKNFFENLGDFILNLMRLVFRIMVKVIGAALVIFGLIFTISLIFGLFGFSKSIFTFGNNYSMHDLSTMVFSSSNDLLIAGIGLFLMIGLPVLALVLGGIRMLFGVRADFKGMGWVLGGLFVVGILMVAFAGTNTQREFSISQEVKESLYLDTIPSDTLFLTLSEDFERYGDSRRRRRYGRGQMVRINDDVMRIYGPEVNIVRGSGSEFELDIYKESRGRSSEDARKRAERLHYEVYQEGSKLMLPPFYEFQVEDGFRMQELYVVLRVPENKSVTIEERVDRLLDDVKNVSNTWDRDMGGKTWTMKPAGLTCIGCDPTEL